MRRLPVLAALVLAALIGASAWLAIVAQSDPEPMPTAEHLPRDDDQSQQQESQAQADPESEPEEEADREATQQETSEEEASEELQEEQETDSTEHDETSDPVDVLIDALDVPRAPVEPEPAATPATTVVIEYGTYVVEDGDTLAEIAETLAIELHDLITTNALDSPDLLHIGQELAIPTEVVVSEPAGGTASSFQPVEIAPTTTEDGIVYGTIRDYERAVVNSAVIATSQTHPSVRLVEACIDDKRRTYIVGLQLLEGPTRIYWRFDDGPLSTDRWAAADDFVESITSDPFIHALYEPEGVRTLWIRIGGQDLTFGIRNLLLDEILVNFSDCGR